MISLIFFNIFEYIVTKTSKIRNVKRIKNCEKTGFNFFTDNNFVNNLLALD